MKSINQIFQDNSYLMDEPEVSELIEYCKELEDELIEHRQKKEVTKEVPLAELVRDLYRSIDEILKADENPVRFKESPPVDFKTSILNLKQYLLKFAKDYKFNF